MAKNVRKLILRFAVDGVINIDGEYCVMGAVGKACGLSDKRLSEINGKQIIKLAQKKFKFKILDGATTDGYSDYEIHRANDSEEWHTVRKWLLKYDDLYNKVKKYALKD